MTGEMSQSEVTKEAYPELFALKRSLHRRGIESAPRAFDQYQGPYLAVGFDASIGGNLLNHIPGTIRVWYSNEDTYRGYANQLVVEYNWEFSSPLSVREASKYVYKQIEKGW